MGVLRRFAKTRIGKPIHIIYMAIKKPIVFIFHIREVDKIKKLIKKTENIILYCGVCETSNMGDLAQTYFTHKWLSENYPEHKVIDCRTSLIMDGDIFINRLKPLIKSNAFFFFQSGYNTHDLGGLEDLMHQKILSAFPDNYMIMLPQTVFFQSDERREQCAKSYNAHKRLLFFARDYESERIAKEMFPSLQVDFLPDIVASAIGRLDFQKKDRRKILLCRRHDVEQYYSENDYKEIEYLLSKIDTTDVEDTVLTDGNKKINDNIENYINSIVEHFSSYKLIVTDKFHGLIFSLIADTPVIVIKTKDHKVTGGYELFNKHFSDSVFFVNEISEIGTVASKVFSQALMPKHDTYYNDVYYKNLKKKIELWIESISE